MARLQKLSRDKNKKLAVIARELIEKEKNHDEIDTSERQRIFWLV